MLANEKFCSYKNKYINYVNVPYLEQYSEGKKSALLFLTQGCYSLFFYTCY